MNQPLSLSLPLRISARIHPSSLSSRVTQTRTLDTLHSRTRVHVFCRVRLTSERSKTITRRGVVADLLADLFFFFFFFHAVVPRPLNGDTTRSNRITRARARRHARRRNMPSVGGALSKDSRRLALRRARETSTSCQRRGIDMLHTSMLQHRSVNHVN